MTLRTRLTLWYGVLVGVILVAALGAGHFTHIAAHIEELDRRAPAMTAAALAEARAKLDASAAQQRLEFAVIALVGFALAVAGGWVLARSALRPIALVTDTARAIADSGTFSGRVPTIAQHDEVGTLAMTFNDMLESLETAHTAQRRFVADASHELRTPMAVIRGSAELLATGGIDDAGHAQAIDQIVRESARVSRLIGDLLVLARADAGAEPLRATEVQLDELVMEAFDDLRPAAGRRLRVTALEAAVVRGERDRLKQLVLILLDNALRYTPPPGRIDVSLSGGDRAVTLRIDDEGVGLTRAVAEHAFERFYRGDAARRIDPSGTGLGLSIARWIVERHGGRIDLRARPAGVGASALVQLPARVRVPVEHSVIAVAGGPGSMARAS